MSVYLVLIDEGQGMLLGGGDHIEHQRGATPGHGLAIRFNVPGVLQYEGLRIKWVEI